METIQNPTAGKKTSKEEAEEKLKHLYWAIFRNGLMAGFIGGMIAASLLFTGARALKSGSNLPSSIAKKGNLVNFFPDNKSELEIDFDLKEPVFEKNQDRLIVKVIGVVTEGEEYALRLYDPEGAGATRMQLLINIDRKATILNKGCVAYGPSFLRSLSSGKKVTAKIEDYKTGKVIHEKDFTFPVFSPM